MASTSLRHSAHMLLHNPTGKYPVTAWLNRFLVALILANAAAVALETVASVYIGYEHAFRIFETVSTAIFLVEYLARLWSCVEQDAFSHPISGRLRWASRPVALLDLIVIATFFAKIDLRFLRLARLFRLLRVLNLEGMAGTYDRPKASIAMRKDLLLVSAVLMFIALFFSAALLYIFEHAAQPQQFSSIPPRFGGPSSRWPPSAMATWCRLPLQENFAQHLPPFSAWAYLHCRPPFSPVL